jgi:hypothetical protein
MITRHYLLPSLLALACAHHLQAQDKPPAVVAPGDVISFIFVCVDAQTGVPVPGVQMTFGVNFVPGTGSHFHTDSTGHFPYGLNPQTGVTGTVPDANVPAVDVTLTTTPIAETAEIKAHCQNQDPNAPDAVADSIVGRNDIFFVSPDGVWSQVGATTAHGSVAFNHWMQTAPAFSLLAATQMYLSMFPDTPGGVVASNDMSLAYGGKFDICSNWDSPHQFHDQGTAADIRGNNNSNAVPVSRQGQFLMFCDMQGGTFDILENACPNDSDGHVQKSNRHMHCQFGGPSTPFNSTLACPGQTPSPCQ